MSIKYRATVLVLGLAVSMFVHTAVAQEAAGSVQENINSFTEAFVTVGENPLPGDLPWLLRQIAGEPAAQTPQAERELSPLEQAAAMFDAIIRDQGVYYEEVTNFMGMDMKAEYWMKGDKFKKFDPMQDEVSLFDGTWFYQYTPAQKTGVRFSADDPQASLQVNAIKHYTLSQVASSPYEQQEDKVIKPFDCQVFYMDIDLMGMKGNWLYIDKETGALVKNQYGKEKGGMTITVTKLEVGALKEDVFEVPETIKIN